MASQTAIQFIELALANSKTRSNFNLSYSDPHQKWIIRNHLISLLQEFPSFVPSFDTFVHNDGTAVTLLYVTGDLRVTASTPPVPLAIWLHQNHPLIPPMVFVVAKSSAAKIRSDHPFVNFPSGSTTCPYLETWAHPRCSLSDLVRNLVNLFSHDHPLTIRQLSPRRSSAHVSHLSKREALDRLAGSIHYDVVAFSAAAEGEILSLEKLRAEMVERAGFAERVVIGGLEEEKKRLKVKVLELTEQADVVINWLRTNHHDIISDDHIEKAFEGFDDDGGGDSESETAVLDCLAADRGAEDVIYSLEKAVEKGVVSLEGYIKQVRILAREQFYQRAMLVKLGGSTAILHYWP